MHSTHTRLLVIRSVGLITLLAAMIWPAIYNSSPYYFPDTYAYVMGVDSTIAKVTGIDTPFVARTKYLANYYKETYHGQNITSSTPLSFKVAEPGKAKLRYLGRSPYYGMLLTLGELGGQFWITILLQALSVLAVLAFLLRVLGKAVWPTLLWIGFPLCVFSDAPFFVSFLMPDLFVAIAILITAAVLSMERRLTLGEAVTSYGLTAAGLAFHDSAIPIVFSLACLYLVWSLLRHKTLVWINCSVLVLAFISAILGQGALMAIYAAEEAAVVRYPFLSGHLIEDGPGTRFLRDTCPDSGFILCQYVHKFPMPSETFMWAESNQGGLLQSLPPTLRQRISEENFRFAIAVFKHYPISVLSCAFRDSAKALIYFPLDEFRYSSGHKALFDEFLPESYLGVLHRSAAYKGRFPVVMFSALNYAFVTLALIYIALRRSVAVHATPVHPAEWKLVVWVLIGILLNATVCGSIAGASARYEARVVWLIPLLALFLSLPRARSLQASKSADQLQNPYRSQPETSRGFQRQKGVAL